MASNAVIGALRVTLGADTAAFDKGLKSAENSLVTFGKKVATISASIGLERAISSAITGLTSGFKKAIDEADKLGKMAQSIGIPVEQLSALKLAADLSGVSLEQLGKGVGILSRQMSEIAGGKAAGGASEAFKALGITVTDTNGNLKSSTQVMEEVADKFAGMEDGAGKTALAIKIFGRAGADLIPLLNQGAKGLKDTREEAEALGLIVDGKTSKAAEAFNDNLTRLHRVLNGIALQVAAELSPALKLLTDQFVENAKAGDLVKTAAASIISGFDIVGRIVGAVQLAISNFTREFGLLIKLLTVPTLAQVKEAFTELGMEANRQATSFASLSTRFQDFREQADMLAKHTENVANNFTKIAAPVLTAKNALDAFFISQSKAIAGQRAEAATVGAVAGARESLRIVMQAEAIAQENNIVLTTRQREQIALLAGEARNAALVQEGYNLLLQSAEPHEKYRLELEKNAAALTAIGATSEQVGRVQQAVAERFGVTWQQVTATVAGQFSQLFTQLAKYGSGFATAAKALAIVEATINTFVAYTKALASAPPPFNYVLAAGTLAAGLAQVLKIKSQTIPKMATGGALTPKAFPGRDSTLMQARIRTDEQVDIWRPGEGPDQRRGAGSVGSTTIILQGESFTRSHIEKLVAGINDLMGDRGGGIKLATAG